MAWSAGYRQVARFEKRARYLVPLASESVHVHGVEKWEAAK
jgi:hypothetical protein